MGDRRDHSLNNSLVELSPFLIFGAVLGGVGGLLYSANVATPSEYATLLSGFGGAVVGAIVSAAVSVIVAKQSASETLVRDRAARDAVQQASALRLQIKTSLILSDVVAIHRSIDESLSEANERQLTHLPLWRRVLPMIGGNKAYEVDADELSPLIEAGESDLMQTVTTLVMQHRILLDAVAEYSALRSEVKNFAATHLVTENGVVTTAMTEEEASRLAPLGHELENLITIIRRRLPELREMAERATFGIGPAMQKHFATSDFPVFLPKGSAEERPLQRANFVPSHRSHSYSEAPFSLTPGPPPFSGMATTADGACPAGGHRALAFQKVLPSR